jgi:hypothetical protein
VMTPEIVLQTSQQVSDYVFTASHKRVCSFQDGLR